MKDFKHTKGEWIVISEHDEKNTKTIYSKQKGHIASIEQLLNEDTEHESNAKLIAAAPDLLKSLNDVIENTLKQLVATCDNSWDKEKLEVQLENCLEAIKKATE